MLMHLKLAISLVMICPLLGAIIAGIFGPYVGRRGAHRVTIGLMIVSMLCALYVCKTLVIDGAENLVIPLYTWGESGSMHFPIGLLVDHLSAMMIVIVTFVSLFVHVYSIGYMYDDPGYQRFFSYVSLFTFMMLCLVLSDNFVMLFFGWEGVGLVSYLLIGFWFKKESAVCGSLKAFLVNRVGDLGFLLGIAAILNYFGSINYKLIFEGISKVSPQTIDILGHSWPVISVVCILLFVGAAAKSAQVPLHVWLPESMEGPTPISALIHAATMVTAGVYMICRMSPLFQFSVAAQSVVIVMGGITCLFMGILGVFQFDIKRVIAYSTLSQLGYMMVAAGASAYGAAMFHLMTHAFFKALLFLAAGSVIIGMHHEQDMRKMGGLWKHMPVTWICFLVGSLSLSAIPPFSGFFSKDAIIDSAHLSAIPGAHFAFLCVAGGAFLTALYSFRCFFMTFHGKQRFEQQYVKESHWVVLLPLVVLAIPSVIMGSLTIKPLLFDAPNAFGDAIFVLPKYDVLHQLAEEFPGVWAQVSHAIYNECFWFSIAGIAVAWFITLGSPTFAGKLKQRFSWLMVIVDHKYGFDDFNQIVIANGTRALGQLFYKVGDVKIVDGWFVNGSGRLVNWFSAKLRHVQTGYLYHYALAMVLGLFLLLGWAIVGS